MKQLTLLILVVIMAAMASAQSVITLQHGVTTSIFTYLDSALAKAQNGDAIYLPGGTISSSNGNGHNLTKKISIFGAGYRADSSAATQPTTLTVSLTFSAGSEGSLLTGVILPPGQGVIIVANNISVTRCNISLIGVDASGCVIEENIIGAIGGDGGQEHNILIRKNVIYTTVNNASGWYVVNNDFVQGFTEFGANIQNCTFSNNIIYNTGGGNLVDNPGPGIVFSNNLFTADYGYAGNKVQSIDSIFTKYTTGAAWDLTQNFKLKAGCKGIKASTDGTDIGIYGTASPFKNSAVPFNPHIQSVSIPASTGLDGKLNISITVAAQNQ